MKQVYSVYNAAEAHIIKHYLEQNDIMAHIHGEHLSGAIGGIAADDHIKILVAEEDVEKARELMKQWESAAADQPEASARSPKRSAKGVQSAIVTLLVGVAIGWLTHSLFLSLTHAEPKISIKSDGKGHKLGYDSNQDGKDDYIVIYPSEEAENATATQIDLNYDGVFDERVTLDEQGLNKYLEADYDFDGRFETKSFFTHGQMYKSEKDIDGDGFADRLSFYTHGLLDEYHILDPKSQQLVKTQNYRNQALVSAKYDSDRDGKLDTLYTYDEFEEVVSEEKLP